MPDLDALAEKAHDAWRTHMASQGVADHPYRDVVIPVNPLIIHIYCGVCGQIQNVPRHLDAMRPFGELTEPQKEAYRVMVRAVQEASGGGQV